MVSSATEEADCQAQQLAHLHPLHVWAGVETVFQRCLAYRSTSPTRLGRCGNSVPALPCLQIHIPYTSRPVWKQCSSIALPTDPHPLHVSAGVETVFQHCLACRSTSPTRLGRCGNSVPALPCLQIHIPYTSRPVWKQCSSFALPTDPHPLHVSAGVETVFQLCLAYRSTSPTRLGRCGNSVPALPCLQIHIPYTSRPVWKQCSSIALPADPHPLHVSAGVETVFQHCLACRSTSPTRLGRCGNCVPALPFLHIHIPYTSRPVWKQCSSIALPADPHPLHVSAGVETAFQHCLAYRSTSPTRLGRCGNSVPALPCLQIHIPYMPRPVWKQCSRVGFPTDPHSLHASAGVETVFQRCLAYRSTFPTCLGRCGNSVPALPCLQIDELTNTRASCTLPGQPAVTLITLYS